LGDDRSGKHRHHTGYLYFYIREWINEREPNGNDDLYADGNQPRGFDHRDRESYSDGIRKPIGNYHHVVSGRNTRGSLCRVHCRGQRRLAAIHLFG
jgi:hypothetical protein